MNRDCSCVYWKARERTKGLPQTTVCFYAHVGCANFYDETKFPLWKRFHHL